MTSGRLAQPLLSGREAPHQGGPAVQHASVLDQDILFYALLWDVAGSLVSALAVFYLDAPARGVDQRQIWGGLIGFAVAWAFSAHVQQLYHRKALLSGLPALLLSVVATCGLTFGLLLLLGFGLDLIAGGARVWLLTWALAVFGWTGCGRVLWRGYMHRRLSRGGCLERALVLAGSAQGARRLADTVEQESKGLIRVAAAVALPGTIGGPTLEWLEETIRRGTIDRVVVGHFADATAQTSALLARLTRLSIDVTLLPDLDGLRAPVRHVDRIGALPAIELDYRPLTPLQARVKRLEDVILAGLLTLFLLPLMLLVSLAIKIDDPGPALFRQLRTGFHNRAFKVWKFRTMYVTASDPHAVRQTSRDDSRVTRVGRFLRRTSLDELPQLFNVLAGDMSIVGPRPHALGMTAAGFRLHEASADYAARHRLKPGITGWAQVNGSRGEVDSVEKLQRRVSLDCDYIERWSLGLDLWIILRTAAMMLFDADAY
jgi:Undecaprenyl-phosphate glucose phosphotransferase